MIKTAIIGAGLWGNAHAEVYRAHKDAECVAVCDLDGSRAAEFASRHGIDRFFTDYNEMLAESDFEAVSIVTPDHLHAGAAVACANAGKHLLIEKPIATTKEDAKSIVRAVRANKVRATVDLHNRWSPPFYEAKRAARAGELGELQHAYFRLNDVKRVATGMLGWAAESSILWFLGSHSLDTLRWIFGSEVQRVYSVSRSGVLESLGIGAPDTYLTTLEFECGAAAQMENSWITPNGNPNVNDIKFNLTGSAGMVSIDASSHNLIQRFTDNRFDTPDVLVKNSVHGKLTGFAYESIKSFVDCLVSGDEFIVTLEDAASTTLALLAVMESANRREPVGVLRLDELMKE
ncbi:MAG: Gfo/Idh/MocA family oxidoreductase [Defluviitaleaceae bacterium]|nr:Gfo/Idh/MocA family oxidoreductase [Defluviitaleaceae bacterium]